MTSINPDAHSCDGLGYYYAGVMTARKGWLGKEHVLNTRSLEEVKAAVERMGVLSLAPPDLGVSFSKTRPVWVLIRESLTITDVPVLALIEIVAAGTRERWCEQLQRALDRGMSV